MILKRITAVTLGSAAALALFAGPALAAVNVGADGTGFIGKGDVQLALTMSNAQLQQEAEVIQTQFAAVTTSVSETSWTCTRTLNNGNVQTQERERVTTTTTTGVITAVARDKKKQVTGFIANGWGASSSASEHEGPSVGSCPSGGLASNQATEDLGSSSIVTVRRVEMVQPTV